MDNIVRGLEEMKYKIRDYMNLKPSAAAQQLEEQVDNAYVHARQGADIDKLEFMVKDIRSFIERIKQDEQVFNFPQSDDLYDRIKQLVEMIDQVERR